MFSCNFLVSGCIISLVRYLFLISSSAIDCLERFVSEIDYLSSGKLNEPNRPTFDKVTVNIKVAQFF